MSAGLEASSGVNDNVKTHLESENASIKGKNYKNDNRNKKKESDENKLKANEEKSLHKAMKDKIALYISYLDSGTDSSDMEQQDHDPNSSENKTNCEHVPNKNNKESTTKKKASSSSNQNEKIKQQSKNEDLDFFEETFQSFTTRWDVKRARNHGGTTLSPCSSPPADQQITSNCSDEQQKPSTSNKLNTTENIVSAFTDNTEMRRENNKPCLLNDGKETKPYHNENITPVLTHKHYAIAPSLFDEVFLLNEKSDDLEHEKRNANGDQSRVDKMSEKQIENPLEEKIARQQNKKIESSHLTVQRELDILETKNIDFKTTHLEEPSEILKRTKLLSNTHLTNDDLKTDIPLKTKTKHATKNYVNNTTDTPNPGNGKDKRAPNEKTKQENTQHAPNHGITSTLYDNNSLPDKKKGDDTSKQNPSGKYTENSQPINTKTKKVERKRSRDISLERDRKRSRSSSTERDNKRKESPKRERRFSRHSEERRTMQRDRQARKRRETSPVSPFNRSWFDNIVVKIADPPRPPRKRQNTNSPQQRRTGKTVQGRNVQRFRSGQRDRNDRNRGQQRRWTYDDYVKTPSGRLRRKTTADCQERKNIKEENPNWKSYDEENTMPYQGFVDSQVQSLLKQLCGHYIPKLHSSKPDQNEYQSAQIAKSGNKLHRNWYMPIKDWIAMEQDDCVDCNSQTQKQSSTDGKIDEVNTRLSSKDKQKKDYKRVTNKENGISESQSCSDCEDDCVAVNSKANSKSQDYHDDVQILSKRAKEPVSKFRTFKLKQSNQYNKSLTSELFTTEDLSESNQEQAKTSNSNNTLQSCASVSIMDICNKESENGNDSLPNVKSHCVIDYVSKKDDVVVFDDVSTEYVLTKVQASTNDEGVDLKDFASRQFLPDTLAISNLCKNRISRYEQMKNDLLVMITPSSYASQPSYTNWNNDKVVTKDDAIRQSLSIPTSRSLSKTTHVCSTTTCFLFEFENFETTTVQNEDVKNNDDSTSLSSRFDSHRLSSSNPNHAVTKNTCLDLKDNINPCDANQISNNAITSNQNERQIDFNSNNIYMNESIDTDTFSSNNCLKTNPEGTKYCPCNDLSSNGDDAGIVNTPKDNTQDDNSLQLQMGDLKDGEPSSLSSFSSSNSTISGSNKQQHKIQLQPSVISNSSESNGAYKTIPKKAPKRSDHGMAACSKGVDSQICSRSIDLLKPEKSSPTREKVIDIVQESVALKKPEHGKGTRVLENSNMDVDLSPCTTNTERVASLASSPKLQESIQETSQLKSQSRDLVCKSSSTISDGNTSKVAVLENPPTSTDRKSVPNHLVQKKSPSSNSQSRGVACSTFIEDSDICQTRTNSKAPQHLAKLQATAQYSLQGDANVVEYPISSTERVSVSKTEDASTKQKNINKHLEIGTSNEKYSFVSQETIALCKPPTRRVIQGRSGEVEVAVIRPSTKTERNIKKQWPIIEKVQGNLKEGQLQLDKRSFDDRRSSHVDINLQLEESNRGINFTSTNRATTLLPNINPLMETIENVWWQDSTKTVQSDPSAAAMTNRTSVADPIQQKTTNHYARHPETLTSLDKSTNKIATFSNRTNVGTDVPTILQSKATIHGQTSYYQRHIPSQFEISNQCSIQVSCNVQNVATISHGLLPDPGSTDSGFPGMPAVTEAHGANSSYIKHFYNQHTSPHDNCLPVIAPLTRQQLHDDQWQYNQHQHANQQLVQHPYYQLQQQYEKQSQYHEQDQLHRNDNKQEQHQYRSEHLQHDDLGIRNNGRPRHLHNEQELHQQGQQQKFHPQQLRHAQHQEFQQQQQYQQSLLQQHQQSLLQQQQQQSHQSFPTHRSQNNQLQEKEEEYKQEPHYQTHEHFQKLQKRNIDELHLQQYHKQVLHESHQHHHNQQLLDVHRENLRQQQQQQQQFHPLHHEYTSEGPLPNLNQGAAPYLSHIPWGEYVLDRRHKTSPSSTLSPKSNTTQLNQPLPNHKPK